jgi:hypothetical protein
VRAAAGVSAHGSHDWGPHHAGIRWVECSACTALLHEPEAELECLGEPSLVEAGRASRLAEWTRRMLAVARRESRHRPGVVDHADLGLWQVSDRSRP